MLENSGKEFFVYMTANKPRGVIYTGMTSDLPGRGWEHRERRCSRLTLEANPVRIQSGVAA